ncbi:hypothetical protein COV06_02985 [Candidatus Uhrbacteria bacterium CG10_big_fil_rev_8_21_14_0_10_50_16]|uniref:Phosphoribosyl-ATP pyrophosphohydrolase n=1 Tax=Candidatus Uhrbacteria bacterium CG10_big_fil_rev_8_21_14_0_10_50_16 TaxID=1975039 RepID=A0A2H0RLQ9_9BACT|nr:MAG: hypothetical protein COV06_02985 [Candidatus Uhrbacteria bacterium CG10_big_fil_rev_8_21_14_0_10_50_16]
MEHNKLVRDRIPEIIRQNGDIAEVRIADSREFQEKLVQKLHEEVREFIENHSAEEATDIIEVLRAYCAILHVDLEELKNIRAQKEEARGGYTKQIILVSTRSQ